MVMQEREPVKETVGMRYYHGDTLENFLLTASVDTESVTVNKSRHPTQRFEEVFSEKGSIEFPIVKAIDKAIRLGHIPIVLQTNLSSCRSDLTRFPDHWFSLPASISFPVQAVLIPNTDFDIDCVDISILGWDQNKDRVMRQFVLANPKELLVVA